MNQARIRTGGCIALALVAGLSVASCEREDAAGDALQKANIKLAAMTPFGTSLPARESKLKLYNEVIKSLDTALKGTPTQAASASLLIAQSQMGLAEPAAARAGELDRQILDQLSKVRSAFSHYLTFSGSADAAASYNPAKELAEIDAADKERAEQIKTETAAKADIERQAAALTAQARGKSDQSRAKRQEAGALHQKVVNQTATEGEKTLIQVRTITREADVLDVGAAQLQAEAAKVLPKAAEIQNTIERLTTQRALLDKQRGEVKRRTQASKEEAARMKAEAAKTGDEIKSLVDGIVELRGGELAEQSKKAEGSYESAAKSAGRASTELKGTAQSIIGTAQQQLGDAQFARARGLHVLARVLEALGAAKPAMVDADKHKSRAEEANAQAKEATEAAFESYKKADAAYNASGATGDAKAKLEKLNSRMRELVKMAGGSDDLIPARGEPAAETPAAPAGETAAATGAADLSTPLGTLQKMVELSEAGNVSELEGYFQTSNAQEKEGIRGLFGVLTKFKKLDQVTKAKFGTSLSEGSKGGMAGAAPNMFGSLKSNDMSSVTVNMQGETAELTIPGDKDKMKMVKKDGRWLVDVADHAQEMMAMSAMIGPFGQALDSVTADVESGKFSSLADVQTALGQKMAQLMGLGGLTPPPK